MHTRVSFAPLLAWLACTVVGWLLVAAAVWAVAEVVRWLG